MKGLVKFDSGKKGMELREIPEPTPTGYDIKVKVIAAGICGSDLHIMNDDIDVCKPVVLGHEFVGIVDEIGEKVSKFKKGDYITSLTTYSSCGKCSYCRQGLVMFCEDRRGLGFHVNGAMAQYMIVSEQNSLLIPKEINNKLQIAACEPFGCAVRASTERAEIRKNDIVVVIGPGPLGQGIVQMAKRHGAYIIVYGLPSDIDRLELSKLLGADEVCTDIAVLTEKVYQQSSCGADIIFEVAGNEKMINLSIDLVRKQGTLVQMGLPIRAPRIDVKKLVDKEIIYTNSFGCHQSTWLKVLKLLKNEEINLDCYTECTYYLEDWKEAFEEAQKRKALKVLILPN